MNYDSYCIACLANRQAKLSRKLLGAEMSISFMKDAARIVAEAPAEVAGAYLTYKFGELYAKYGVTADLYAQEKKDSNDFVLSVLPQTEKAVAESAEPLKTALKFSRIGNFLDFGILDKNDVDSHFADDIAGAPELPLDESEYRHLVSDLQTAKKLLILGDNAGEIGLDTMLVKELKKQYPGLAVTYCVRGGNALNDATREDAAAVGMDRLCAVIDNGLPVPSTEPALLGEECRRAIAEADIILSKGQANFESLVLSGHNIYYLFLCKCERLCKCLGLPLYTGCFLNERRLPELTPYPG